MLLCLVLSSFICVSSHSDYGSLRGKHASDWTDATGGNVLLQTEIIPQKHADKAGEHYEKAVEKVEDEYDQAIEDSEHSLKAAQGEVKTPEQMIREDINRTLAHLMPGKKPEFHKKEFEMFLVLFAFAWFSYFFSKLYRKDQSDNSEPWHIPSAETGDIEPDFVLVFHNPAFEYSDNENIVANDTLLALMKADEHANQLRRTEVFINRQELSFSEQVSKQMTLSKSNSGILLERTFKHVREALLQDVYEDLARSGFDLTAFTSVDGDEIFLCVSLTDEACIEHKLALHNIHLQIKKDVVKELGVEQPPEEEVSSPPLLAYDAKIPVNILGPDAKSSDFYKLYDSAHGKETIMSSADRTNAILGHLFHRFNMDMAIRQGLLVKWFPAHCKKQIKDFDDCWAKWRLFKDLSCVQPLAKINEYFGPRVALLFAWNAVYAKALLALLPVAIVFEIVNLVWSGGVETSLLFWDRGSILGFSIIVTVWARIAMNICTREEEYLISMFGVKDSAHHNKASRPDFSGDWEISTIDRNEMVLAYPAWKHNLRLLASWIVTLLFCGFNMMVITVWYDNFDGVMNPAASVILAVMIGIFTQIFNWMGEALTICENHTLPATFYSSYLAKMFIFQFVNRYCPFFYIAVKQQFTLGGCPMQTCVGQIAKSMPITIFCLVACRSCTVIAYGYMVDLMTWLEDYQMKRKGEKAKARSYVESQGKYVEFGDREQVEVTVELVLALGFVLIFGAVAPRIIPICLIVFLVQLRAIAVMLTRTANRTVPRKVFGVGPMRVIVAQLMYFGMAFTGYLLVQFGPLFRDTRTLTKLTGFVCFVLFAIMLLAFVDLMVPNFSAEKDILEARREHVAKKLVQKNSDVLRERMTGESNPKQKERRASYQGASQNKVVLETEVLAGQWDSIPGHQD